MEKIQLKHPAGKKAVSMDQAKYEPLKKALLNHLKTKGASTHTEIEKGVTEELKSSGTQFQGSVPWHLEWVKLDLEANKIIERIAGSSPQKYAIVNNPSRA